MIRWTNKKSVLAAVRKWPDIFGEEILAALEHSAAVLVGRSSDLAPAGSGASGSLHASIHYNRPEATGAGWRVTWGTNVDHAETIEHGRTPGSTPPPVEEIARWAYTKFAQLGIELQTFKKGERAGEQETEEEAATRVAYAIAKKIGRDGFSSGPVAGDSGGTAWKMFERGTEAARSEVESIFRDCRDRISQRINAAEAR